MFTRVIKRSLSNMVATTKTKTVSFFPSFEFQIILLHYYCNFVFLYFMLFPTPTLFRILYQNSMNTTLCNFIFLFRSDCPYRLIDPFCSFFYSLFLTETRFYCPWNVWNGFGSVILSINIMKRMMLIEWNEEGTVSLFIESNQFFGRRRKYVTKQANLTSTWKGWRTLWVSSFIPMSPSFSLSSLTLFSLTLAYQFYFPFFSSFGMSCVQISVLEVSIHVRMKLSRDSYNCPKIKEEERMETWVQ